MTIDLVAEPSSAPKATVQRVRVGLDGLVRSESAWIVACLAAAAADAFIGRDAMNPDGISYIDMARAALLVGPRGLVNGYWSPGYPALIAAMLRLIRPGTAAEFAVVHLLN